MRLLDDESGKLLKAAINAVQIERVVSVGVGGLKLEVNSLAISAISMIDRAIHLKLSIAPGARQSTQSYRGRRGHDTHETGAAHREQAGAC